MRALVLLFTACTPTRSHQGVDPLPTTNDEPTAPVPDTSEFPTVLSSTLTTVPEPDVTHSTVESALPPVLSVTAPAGAYDGPFDVEITTTDPTADIWYTLDGSRPTIDAALHYDGLLTVDTSSVLRAVSGNAWGLGWIAVPWVQLDADLVGFSSNLPLVVLWTVDQAPDYKSEIYTPFSLVVFEPDPVSSRTTLPGAAALGVRAGLKIRGSSSAGYPKHPYRLETWLPDVDAENDVELLGMPAEGDWILGAPLDFDRALMRDPLIFALSNQVGRYAPRTEHVEMFIAEVGESVGIDDYVGVYVAGERIERDAERVNIEKLLPSDVAEPELSGGYIFKEDRTGPGESGFYAGTGGGILDFQQPFVNVDPTEDEIAGAQDEYLQNLLDELGIALVSPGFTHPVSGRHYEEIIDVDAWIDHHILNILPKNPDAFRLSGYFHKDRDGLLIAGPVWDFDRTMGCNSDSRCDQPTWWDAQNITPDCTFMFDHGFWGGLFDDPVFVERYYDRLEELLTGQLSMENINIVIDDMQSSLIEAAPRNFIVWSAYPPDGSFDAEVQHLRDWLSTRHAWMTECLLLPNPSVCAGD